MSGFPANKATSHAQSEACQHHHHPAFESEKRPEASRSAIATCRRTSLSPEWPNWINHCSKRHAPLPSAEGSGQAPHNGQVQLEKGLDTRRPASTAVSQHCSQQLEPSLSREYLVFKNSSLLQMASLRDFKEYSWYKIRTAL